MNASDPDFRNFSPDYWRQRAEEVREAIKGIVHPRNKKILEQVAKSYDEMAILVEERPTRPERI